MLFYLSTVISEGFFVLHNTEKNKYILTKNNTIYCLIKGKIAPCEDFETVWSLNSNKVRTHIDGLDYCLYKTSKKKLGVKFCEKTADAELIRFVPINEDIGKGYRLRNRSHFIEPFRSVLRTAKNIAAATNPLLGLVLNTIPI